MNNREFKIKFTGMLDSSKTIKNLNSQISTLENKIKELKIKVSKNTGSDIARGFSSLDKALKSVGITSKDMNKNFDALRSRIDSNGDSVKKLTDNKGRLLTVNEKIINGQKRFTTSLTTVDNAVDKNAKQADKWNYSWAKAFQSFTTYYSVTTVFYMIKKAIGSMISEVAELDASLVELRKVTDLEGQSLKDFTAKAYEAGTAVAKTGWNNILALAI